jgi:exosome complex RNA-binding protein Rrp42 (RNase PH superfamily)
MNNFTGIKLEHECGENPYDAVSFAVKSALYATQIPSIKISTMDGYQHELEVFNNMVYIIAKCLPYIILILRLIVVEKHLEEECGRRVFWPQPEFCHLQRDLPG